MVTIPKYTMGEQYVDFAPVTNALAAYRDQNNKNRAFDQQGQQFQATNALARAQLGIQQQSAARADQMFPLQLRQMEAQIDAARRQGATEAQLAPLKMAQMQAQTELARAQASSAMRKDELNSALGGMIQGMIPKPGGGQPMQPPNAMPQGGIQPQSFNGGGDPMLIPTQVGGGQAPQQQPQAAPDMVNTPAGPMPMEQAQKFGFALGLAGKGDAGKMFIDAANANKIGKEGMNKIDEEIIAKVGDVSELDNIKKQFRPEFLEIGGRLKAMGVSWQSYFSSKSVKPEDRKFLADYSRFAAASQERINTRIKAMSGSAVSGHEEVRLNKANPTVNDDPITYESKLNEQIYLQRSALSRYMWLKNVRGLNHDQIANLAKSGKIESLAGLDDMRQIVDKRAGEIEQQLQGRMPPDRIQGVVRQRLKQEFGI